MAAASPVPATALPGAAAPSSAETDSKWTNWAQAMNVKRDDMDLELARRSARLAGLESRLPGEVAASHTADVAGHENEGVAAAFQRLGKWTTGSFEPLTVLGQGAFGTVHLVRRRGTQELYALKQMEKSRYQQKNRQRAYSERDALAEASSRWSVELLATFQDAGHVYMVTEFVQGGDLIAHLSRRRRFTEQETRFYMAELTEAIDTVHQCGLVHRDIKPDNLVITTSGHLKLLDFGLCKLASADGENGEADRNLRTALPRGAVNPTNGRQRSVVGTPQYMSPEGFTGHFDFASDLWAIGIIAFECLVGVVPFHAGQRSGGEAIRMIRDKILFHAEGLPRQFEKTRQRNWTNEVSEEFLGGLICARERRLDAKGIRTHRFFSVLDFNGLHLQTPPIIPQISGPEDTSYFEDFKDMAAELPKVGSRLHWDKDLEWANYEKDGRTEALQRGVPELDAANPDGVVESGEKFTL